MRTGSDLWMAVGIVALACVLGALIGLLAYSVSWDGSDPGTQTWTCDTSGATMYSKTTKNGKYTTLWCLKGGKVVP